MINLINPNKVFRFALAEVQVSFQKAWLGILLGSMLANAPLGAQTPESSRAVAVTSASGSHAQEGRRIALVIGNGAYPTSPLKNPPNDARAVSGTLLGCGFQVQTLVDATLSRMESALRTFGQSLKAGGVGLFYYAGHGMQVKGINYLIPVGADITEEDEVRFKALDADQVLAKMESAANGLNLMILDACRNDPFGRSWHRGGPGGLAQMDAPTGTYIAFATAPGKTASDGAGENGLYTQHLLRALQQPGLKVEEVFKQVRVGVRQASRDQQVPWDISSLTGEFYFRPDPRPGAAQLPVESATTGTAAAVPMKKGLRLVVYRKPNRIQWKGSVFQILVDDRVRAGLGNRDFVDFEIPAGERTLKVINPERDFAVGVLQTQTRLAESSKASRFFRIDAGMSLVLSEVDEATWKQEAKKFESREVEATR